MAKPEVPNRRSTTWRPAPADDRHAEAISNALRIVHGIEAGHTGAIRFALKFTAARLNETAGAISPF